MDENTKTNMEEIANLIGHSWEAIAICAGMKAGIYEELSADTPVSITDISKIRKYDEAKLEKWFYYMTHIGILREEKGGYFLTAKGEILSSNSAFKDLLGMFQLTEFFMESATKSDETFKKNMSLDKLSEGRMSTQYQPKVSDVICLVLIDVFKEYKIGNNDTLLDFGCGNGSFLRALEKKIPDVKFTGVDKNLFAIEKGKKENADLGLTEKIRLLVDDVTDEMEDFEDESFDWVTGINLFHFIPVNLRNKVIDNMVRICDKGVFFTEGVIEVSLISAGANALTPLLWNDFSGLYKKSEADHLNRELKNIYKNFSVKVIPIMQGTSNLVIMLKG